MDNVFSFFLPSSSTELSHKKLLLLSLINDLKIKQDPTADTEFSNESQTTP